MAIGSDSLVTPPRPGNYLQFEAAGSNKYIVWAEGVASSGQGSTSPQQDTLDIRALDLKSGLAFDVSTADGAQWRPAIDGSTVVWLDGPYGGCGTPACYNNIRGKTLPDGPEFTVAAGHIGGDRPGIANGKVSWVELDGNTSKLMLKDLSNNTTVTVAIVAADPFVTPLLSSEYIAWMEVSPKAGPDGSLPFYAFRTYNLKTGHVKTILQRQLTDPARPPRFALSGHYLVWQSSELRLLDINNGNETVLTNDYTGLVYVIGRHGAASGG